VIFSSAYLFFEKAYVNKIYMALVCVFLAQNLVYSRYSKKYEYLVYTPWAEFVLDHAPALYNPVPEIFIERGRHTEGFDNTGIYFYSYDGEIRKILLNKSVNDISEISCSDGQKASRYVKSNIKTEEAWVYYNLERGCQSAWNNGFSQYGVLNLMPSIISFDSIDNRFYARGWSISESDHRWSDGENSDIVFALKKLPKIGLGVNIKGVSLGHQRATVRINGHILFDGRIPDGGFPYFKIKRTWLNLANNVVSFHFPDAHQPGNGDMRILAFAVFSIYLSTLGSESVTPPEKR